MVSKNKKPKRRKSEFDTFSTPVSLKRKDLILNAMKEHDANGWIRSNMFGGDLIWGQRRFVMGTPEGRKDIKHLFIFGCVKRDAIKYCKTHSVKSEKLLNSTVFNTSQYLNGKRLTGTDLDNAYWRIAMHLGIISSKTYEHGIRIDNKRICLAALATMGTEKTYFAIKKGMVTQEVVIVEGDEQLRNCYTLIKNTCFTYMQALQKMLGKDFACYKTDCIYYVKKESNVKKVLNFIESKKLDCKMMGPVKKADLKAD